MRLTVSESDLAWAALKRGLITLEDVEKAAATQQKERADGHRQPRSLTVILIAQGKLEAYDVARLLSSRSA